MEKGSETRVSAASPVMSPLTTHRKHLYFSAFAANLLYVSMGCTVAWPSAALPLLEKHGIQPADQTWIVSLLMVGCCCGPIVNSITLSKLGRKYCLLLTGVIYLVSWMVLGLSTEMYSLCLGRFIGGIAVSSTLISVPLYVSEISDVKLRQTLTSFTELFISLGCMVIYAAGPWLTYGNLVVVSIIPALLFGLATARIPESPYHLVAKGRLEQAFATLARLRGPSQTVSEELTQIENFVKESTREAADARDLLRKRGPRRSLLLSGLMMIIVTFTCIDIISSYLGPILQDTTLPVSPTAATVIVGAMKIIFSVCQPLLVHRFGSKLTMIISSFLCSLLLLLFGLYKYFDERHYLGHSCLDALPIIFIILYMFLQVGAGTIPWSISAELFTPSLKDLGMNIATTMHWVVDFILVMLFGNLSRLAGVSWFLIVFSAVLAAGTALVAAILPDTKGHSLPSIQRDLQRSPS